MIRAKRKAVKKRAVRRKAVKKKKLIAVDVGKPRKQKLYMKTFTFYPATSKKDPKLETQRVHGYQMVPEKLKHFPDLLCVWDTYNWGWYCCTRLAFTNKKWKKGGTFGTKFKALESYLRKAKIIQ